MITGNASSAMYRIFSFKILCDDKVESPFIRRLHSAVQVCTVWSRGPLSPKDAKPREVVQLDAAIVAIFGEHSSFQRFKYVRKVTLRAFGEDKAEVRQYCFIFCECTVLDFQRHRLCELAGCWDPEDRAEEVCTFRKLKLPRETHSDVDLALSHARWEAVFRNMKPQSIPLPRKWATFIWNCELSFSNHLNSMNWA